MTSISTTNAAASSAAPTGAAGANPQLREAAEAFEAIFLRQILGSMRNARLADDIFGSAATDQFRDMADAQTAESMAETGSFGIAEMLLSQFGRQANAQAAGQVRIGGIVAAGAAAETPVAAPATTSPATNNGTAS